MNNIFVGVLITGAAVAAGYAAYKFIKGKNSEPDYDDDIYDYPDPYDSDESIDFEINDSTVRDLADDMADAADDLAEDAADAADDLKDKAEDAVDDIKDAAEDIVDDIKDAFKK
ncbi:MAG: YtxH domain-containing protein [Ruminococcus sp.]|nr:YtxH domain-containing protein [Ruminococcus sp.]